jgi:hypothetical protein
MFGDLAVEIGTEYNFFLASTDTGTDKIKTYSLSSDGLPDFSNVKISNNSTS